MDLFRTNFNETMNKTGPSCSRIWINSEMVIFPIPNSL